MTFSQMKSGKAAEQIAGRIRAAMQAGDLKAGDRLPPERELIRMLGFSRAVVREGLRLLEADGMVVLRSGRNGGAIIERPNSDRLATTLDTLLRMDSVGIGEISEVLRCLETQVVELAIKRISAHDIKALYQTIEAIEQNPDDAELVRLESNRFHILLADATRNRMLALLTGLVRQIVIRMNYQGAGSAAREIAHVHRRILAAIEAGDVAAAQRRTIRHLGACEHVLNRATRGERVDISSNNRLARALSATTVGRRQDS